MQTKAKPGAVLKRVRLANGWTLTDVSERTGLPVSTLSKVENDKMSLSYDKLARISRGLDIDIGQLFSAEAKPGTGAVSGRRSISRAGEGRLITTEPYEHLYPATDLLNKRFVPIVVEVRARNLAEFKSYTQHPGEEYTYVLEGALELHTELYAPVRLEVGDSIYFDSGMGHVYLAVGPGPCRVLSICSGEESQLIAAIGRDAVAAEPAAKATGVPSGDVTPVKASRAAPAQKRRRAARG